MSGTWPTVADNLSQRPLGAYDKERDNMTHIWKKTAVLLLLVIIGVLATMSSATATDETENAPKHVTAPAPTFTDPTCEANVINHEETETEGIAWFVDDSHRDNKLTLIVTAEALDGYVIDGQTVWTHTYGPFVPDEVCNPPKDKTDEPAKTKTEPVVLPDTGASPQTNALIGMMLIVAGVAMLRLRKKI